MADIVSAIKRSEMMSGIKGHHTTPELTVRSLLHKAGYRFRLHQKILPGKPDIVLSKYKAAIFVNGCFWHCHSCSLFKWPASNIEFWKGKIEGNKIRDEKNIQKLLSSGIRVLVIWECSLRGKYKLAPAELMLKCDRWLKSNKKICEISGK